MDHTQSHPNLHPIAHPPKFARRSMSPIDYINSPHYQAKVKAKQMHVHFSYVPNPKLEKISRTRRENILAKTPTHPPHQLPPPDKQHISNILESSFAKTHNDTSSFEKNISKFINDPTIETDFLKVFDEDSEISHGSPHLNEELEIARKKILQLEAELEAKNSRIIQQAEEIGAAENRYCECMRWAQKLKNEWEKTKIQVMMERRRNEEHIKSIGRLKQGMMRKQLLVDRLIQKQRRVYGMECSWYLELSPEKGE